MTIQQIQEPSEQYVPETTFGKWFLRTETWSIRVLDRALDDLERLMPDRPSSISVVADIGCGWGLSLKKLHERFSPSRLIGIEIEPEILTAAQTRTSRLGIPVDYVSCSASNIQLEDNSVDLLFCHQTFHHLIHQEQAIAEFFRVLKPGGRLLFAESTRRYIHSWIIRFLFRHPMKMQKSAPEYLALVRNAGFVVDDNAISYPYLWWSREDLGIMERCFKIVPPENREETLINLVAKKLE